MYILASSTVAVPARCYVRLHNVRQHRLFEHSDQRRQKHCRHHRSLFRDCQHRDDVCGGLQPHWARIRRYNRGTQR